MKKRLNEKHCHKIQSELISILIDWNAKMMKYGQNLEGRVWEKWFP